MSILGKLGGSIGLQVLGATVLSLGIILLVRLALRRRKYSQLIPSTSHGLFNIFGDALTFPIWFAKGVPFTHYLVRHAEALSILFQNKNVFIAWLSYVPLVGINKPDAVEEILSKTHTNEKAWFYEWFHRWFGTGLLTSHGDKWKSRRKLLQPTFQFDVLKSFIPIMSDKSMQMVHKWKKECEKDFIDVKPHLTLCSLDIICGTIHGVDIRAQDEDSSPYLDAVGRFLEVFPRRFLKPWEWLSSTFDLSPVGKKQNKDIDLLHDFSMSLIQKRKKELQEMAKNGETPKRKTFLEALIGQHLESKDFTLRHVQEEVDTFTFEGHDTVSIGLVWTVYHIGLLKDIQAKIHEELDRIFGSDNERPITNEDLGQMTYFECVIKESLRISPPVPIIARKAHEGLTVGGCPMPEGATMAVAPYSLHRDPEVFPNPEVFDPSRFTPENSANRHPYAYIPFSAGPRNCIGQRFAMMELKIVIANILRHYEIESLDGRCKLLPCFAIILKPSGPVRVRVRPRTIAK